MSTQPRIVKVLAALLVSMTTGAVILAALGNNLPLAGPFRLPTYYRRDSVDKVVRSEICQPPNRWDSIEISFSGTQGGTVSRFAAADLNCHFLLCNGNAGHDGEIQTTERWRKQWSIPPSRTWQGSERTIRICLVGDGCSTLPTDYQLKRLEALLEALCRRFHIQANAVYLPSDCR